MSDEDQPATETGSTFEIELRRRLGALAEYAPTEPTTTSSDAVVDIVNRPGLGRRLVDQRWMVGAAAALIVVVGGMLIRQRPSNPDSAAVVVIGDDGVETSEDDPDPVAPSDGGRWRPMAPAPITVRAHAATGWTGTEALFWAGSSIDRGSAFSDGAAYNPTSDSWRPLPVPGWGHPGISSAYFEGSMYATAKGGGSRLNFDDEHWTDMAPMTDMVLAATVATSRGVFGLGIRSFVNDGSGDIGVAQYFPDGAAWGEPVFTAGDAREATTPTFGALIERPAFWSGTHIVVWQSGGQAIAFDPETAIWETLPDLTVRPSDPIADPPNIEQSIATTSGLGVVAATADANGMGTMIARLPEGASHWNWRADVLPIEFDETLSLLPAGDWMLLVSAGDAPISYHIPSGAWFQNEDGPRIEAPNSVWTGEQLVVWGGGNATTEGQVTDTVWTAPAIDSFSDGSATSTPSSDSECDIAQAAERLGAGLPTIDHELSSSPVDLQQRSRAVVRGIIISATPETGDRIEGTNLLVKGDTRWIEDPGDTTWINDLWIPSLEVEASAIESDPGLSVAFVAFVDKKLPNGSWAIFPDGLWIACRSDETAMSAMVQPEAAGWTTLLDKQTSLNGIWAALDRSLFSEETETSIGSTAETIPGRFAFESHRHVEQPKVPSTGDGHDTAL